MLMAWNLGYDRPRVAKALGIDIPREACVDPMDFHHVLHNAWKRKLGFATSMLPSGRGLKMWKHLSHIEPEYYSAVDGIALWRNYQDCLQIAKEQGSEQVWDLLHVRLDPALDHMSRVGMLLDKRVHSQLSAKLGEDLARITAEMNAIVPETVKSPKVWKTLTGAEKGRETLIRNAEAEGTDTSRLKAAEFFTIPAMTTVIACKQCGAQGVTKDHVTRKFLKQAKEAQ